MSHVAWWEGPLDLEVDAVVVGSGAGGAVAADVLARAGLQVAMVEAGAWRDPEHYPASTYGFMRDLLENWGATFTQGRAFWPVVQGRAVGGSTVINSAICVRTPADVFGLWRDRHGVNGLEDDVWEAQDALEQELSVEVTAPEHLHPQNTLAKAGAERVGYTSYYMQRYARDCQGSGACMSGCRHGRKQSTNVVQIPRLLNRGGVVLSNAPVKRVCFEGERAVGVEGQFRDPTGRRGARFTVRARRAVVLAASATHTPCLLQRSGFRAPGLGMGFRAHPGTGVIGVYDDPIDMNRGATQGWASTAFREDQGIKLESLSIPPDMLTSRLQGGGTTLTRRVAQFRHMAMWVLAVRARSVGTVKNGLFDRPTVRYTLGRADMERLRRGLALVARTHFAAGAKRVMPGISGFPAEIGPDELHLLEEGPLDPRRYFAVLSHLFGGCSMGADPHQAVCDGNGRVHGARDLYVMDASAIPTTLGVNPQHTIMGLARVWAERLANR